MSTSQDRDNGQPEWDAVRADDRYLGWRDLTVWKSPFGRVAVALARRAARWIGPYPVLALTLLIGVVLAVALTAASVEIYEAVAEADGVAGLDKPALQAAMAARTPQLNTAVTAFTNLGGPVIMPILAAVAAIALAIRRRQVSPVVLMAVATAGSLLMTIVGKALVGRIRPPLADAVAPYETSASFPSGHALNAVVVAGVVAYLLVLRQRRWRSRTATVAAAVVFAVAMGLSRVFLGHHWLTDVLVAWTLGLAWLAVVITMHRLYLSVRHMPLEAGRRARRAQLSRPGPRVY
ncbi:phosphatase PAP2 family protein [Dactylosporangium sp. CA-139066]|uniref:phosphatase PAP2 family protein n=1 Tax=Dactylosporangium sp. CA-139066 TaxID=3239930 RepID=UPI003D89DCF4